MYSRIPFFPGMIAFLCVGSYASAQTPTFARPQARILQRVNEDATVTLKGNVHPMALASLSKVADAGTPMDHMILSLKGDATQEDRLAQLIAQQTDPKSPLYHRYLSPQEFGAQFGVAESDISKIKLWLQDKGFKVEETPAGNRSIIFSGSTGQVTNAFKTEIRSFSVGAEKRLANAADPQIPAAFAATVGGIVKLHSFQHTANISKQTPVTAAQLSSPQYNSGSGHYLSPADYATIYNINPLYTAGVNGSGQTIGVIARSNIYLSDVQTFRTNFGLKANNPQILLTGSDPGVLQGDSLETTLDTEWAGAIAPSASIKVIVAASTRTADGIDLAALYAVNHNVAPVLSLSYGSCEASMGSSEVAFYNSLWQQAAAQGISVMVSAGDSGAAGCYGGSASSGSGQGVNGLCSSPYATCVGGTQFVEGSNPGQYWLPGNNPSYGSAMGYIPEAVWNESGSNGGSGLWGGGGGASIAFAKPSWQAGPGVPADGKRDVPDVSLTASGHDGYLITVYGGLNSVGGTSASAPAFAGLMALINQKTNSRQGNANAVFYPLAAKQAAGGAAIFHDTIAGNNSVPGVTGFSATAGYDRATGLGSVDANQLISHWTDSTTSGGSSITLTASATSLSVKAGQAASSTTITSKASATLAGAVALTITGAPAGLSATFATPSIAAPGSGASVLNISAATSTTPGTYALTVTAKSGATTATMTISVEVVLPTFTVTTSVTSITALTGASAQLTTTLAAQNGFSTAATLSISGLPAGVTAAFTAPTVAGSNGSSVLTLTLAQTAAAGSYPLTITAQAGSMAKTAVFSLVVTIPASCTLAYGTASASVSAGESVSLNLSCGSVKGTFSTPLSLGLSGTPAGMTAKFTPATLTAGSTTALMLSSTSTTAAGRYNLTLTATATNFAQSLSIPVTIVAANTFNVSASGAPSIKPGAAGSVTVSTASVGLYNSSISLAVSGLPSSVTASLSSATMPAPGNGSALVTFAVGSAARAGTYTVYVTATGAGVSKSAPITLTVLATQDFAFVLSTSAITIQQGGKAAVTSSTGNFTGGYNGQINMSFSGLAAGMNWGVTGATAANNMVNITYAFSAATYTPVGTYQLTITASGAGGIVHSGVVQVTITAASTQIKK